MDECQPLLYASFNSLATRISVGTYKGFMIYSIDPWKLLDKLDDGGCSIVEVLDDLRVVVTVGTGDTPISSKRIVKIYDMNIPEKEVSRIPFETPVLGVKITVERVVIVLEAEIHIFNMKTLSFLTKLNTRPNPKGIVSITSASDNQQSLLAYLSPVDPSMIVLYNLSTLQHYRTISELHNHQLQIIQFSQDTKFIATGSEAGTVVKIVPVQEEILDRYKFRRSLKPAEISSLAFDKSSNLLALSSKQGTVHIFDRLSGLERSQPRSSFQLGDWLLGEEARSFATIRLMTDQTSIIAFSPDSKVIYTITADGKFSQWQLGSRSQSSWISSNPVCKLIHEDSLI
jgi:WD40 repeat protein